MIVKHEKLEKKSIDHSNVNSKTNNDSKIDNDFDDDEKNLKRFFEIVVEINFDTNDDFDDFEKNLK